MIDAREWVDRYCPADAPEGPKCAGNILPEQVEPGDVMADGSVLLANGCYVWSSLGIWVLSGKARNAAYYGWHVHAEPICCDQQGRVLRLISRA